MSPKDFDILALDAMGVIYEACDDVTELLVPFIEERGGIRDAELVQARYIEASLGRATADEFWLSMGLNAALEDDYLARHRVRSDVEACLSVARQSDKKICCISNDVAEWSKKLRHNHGLTEQISHWFISGDIGARKPDTLIYQRALDVLGVSASRVLFVDDRPKNLDAAASLGMSTLWRSDTSDGGVRHRRVSSLLHV